MNIKFLTSLALGLLSSILFFSCNNNDTDIDYVNLTNDAQIYSFSLTAPVKQKGDSVSRAQDSLRIEVVNKTNYSIDQVSSIIYNADSLPYLTQLEKVLVKVSFNPTYGISSIQVQLPDSTYMWNTTDSINFSKLPVKFIVTSRGNTTKTYNIDIRTHKIDPNLIVWKQQASLPIVGKTKTILKDDTFYVLTLANGKISLEKSAQNNVSWSSQAVSGLPSTINVESFVYANSLFNVIDQTGLSYTSTDGVTWSKANNNLVLKAILGILPSQSDYLIAIIQDGNSYYFAKGSSLKELKAVSKIQGYTSSDIPSTFPLSGAATAAISSDKMLIVGAGVDQYGNNQSATWLIKNASDGIEITSFTKATPFDGGAGLSLFGYDKQLYILKNRQFYISSNWGETWAVAPQKQSLDDNILSVQGQTVVVDKDNYIWILGGSTKTNTYLNGVWKGRLNKLIP